MKKNLSLLIFLSSIPLCAKTKPYTITLNPLQLLNPQRFGLMAHYIYADLYDRNAQTDWGTHMYKQYIQVTRNFRERKPKKKCFEDFVNSFNATLDDIKKNGFNDNKSKILIMQTRNLLNGFHRTSACLLYGCDVTCNIKHCTYCSMKNTAHDLAHKTTYTKTGLDKKYIDAMALHYCMLKKNCFIVLVFPKAFKRHETIEKSISDHGSIVYKKEVSLSEQGQRNLVRKIYGSKKKTNKYFSRNKIQVLLCEYRSEKKFETLKTNIKKLSRGVYITKNHTNALELAQTFFVKNSIHFLNRVDLNELESFTNLIVDFKQWIKDNDYDNTNFCLNCESHVCDQLEYFQHTNDLEENKKVDDIIFNPEYHFYYQRIKIAGNNYNL